MLILPVSRGLDWRIPPLVTLLLILVNTLIYFGAQHDENTRAIRAYYYYAESTLPQIELPRYVKHLEAHGHVREAIDAEQALAQMDQNDKWFPVLQKMETDEVFMQQLRADKIITPSEVKYAEWREARNEYERRQNKRPPLTDRFGFKTAAPTLASLFGHMFLHGDFSHLLGNMAILFIIGCLVEKTLGWRRYLCFYLLSGLGAVAFFWLFSSANMNTVIGASGAISGVMAMFVALYGFQKIRFFYWALVYFGFFTAPAIIVLPYWLIGELYQHFFARSSGVAYMAHFGGLVTGTALIAALRVYEKILGRPRAAAPTNEAPTAPLPPLLPGQLAKIDALLGELRIDEARQALARLARKHPRDIAVLERYYQVARYAPASEDYHRAAALIFTLPENAPDSERLVRECFVDYLKRAQPTVRLSADLLVSLIRHLARAGYTADAERLTQALARRAPEDARLPDLLLRVAGAYQKAGNAAGRDALIARLHAQHPDSEAARTAAIISH